MSSELEEIWTLYADDGATSLDTVEEALFRLKDAPNDTAAIASLFRAIHTFKGNARVLGLEVIESRAHLAEDLVGLVRDEGAPLDSEMQALLLEAADALRGMLEESAAHRRDADAGTTGDLARRMQEKREACRLAKDLKGVGDSQEAAVPPAPRTKLETSEAAAQPGEPEAIIFDVSPVFTGLADDPLCRDIFRDLLNDTLRVMRQALLPLDDGAGEWRTILKNEAERLRHAANQIGLSAWSEMLSDFLCLSEASITDAEALLAQLERMREGEFQGSEPPVAESVGDVATFFNDLEPLVTAVSWYGVQTACGSADAAAIRRTAMEIKALAEARGFVHVVDVAEQLATSQDSREFRRFELRLYEELASIEAAVPEQCQGVRRKPTAILQTWCASNVFETLKELGEILSIAHKNEDLRGRCSRLDELMRCIQHACRVHGFEVAAFLSISLRDLIARVETGELAPDPLLGHIARSFVAAMCVVFDTVRMGEAPNMAAIEQLLEDTTQVAFASNGAANALAVEKRLNLPPSFSGILTPESVKIAQGAIDKGHRFYVVRADLNRDDEVAGRFLDWIGSGTVTAISNVTVFEKDTSLFDFLLATSLDETEFAEAMAVLDPKRHVITEETFLGGDHSGADGYYEYADRGGSARVDQPGALQNAAASDMLESIGEIVASQAAVHYRLSGIVAEDIGRSVEALLRDAGGDWTKARTAVRQTLEGFTDRMEAALQGEAQLNAQLIHLQEEAIALRSRSAMLLLKPLQAFAEATARQQGRQIAVTCSGDDLTLDQTMLERLKGPLRGLIEFCIGRNTGSAGSHLHIGLVRHDDHVEATVEDDCCASAPNEEFDEIRSALKNHGGSLRANPRPTGGMRFHVTLPMAAVVMDGMVIGVGGVRYVVPLEAIQRIVHATDADLIRVSADSGRHMLKLGQEDIVPVQFLQAKGGSGERPVGTPGEAKRLFVVVGRDAQRTALSIDELVGQQVLPIRPLQGYLAEMRGVIGCALLGGGEVGMVLDVNHLLSREP